MKSEIIDRDLLDEIEGTGRGSKQGLFGGRTGEDLDAHRLGYRLGRTASEVWPSFLDAKLMQYDDYLSRCIVTLQAREKELAKRGWRAWGGHLLAIVIGFSILATALLVDYSIIHEFWTRALSNEFGEVPRSLASSVFFKSAQVVFATLAFHLFLDTIGPAGRRVFIVFIFSLTFIMLLGIGIIIANRWLPAGSQLFGIDLNQAVESSQDMLASIGLGAPAADAVTGVVASGPITEADVKTAQTLLWMGSLSLIFIIVTGVGALCMRFGIHGFDGIFGDITFDSSRGGRARRGYRADELLRVREALEHFRRPHSRLAILQGHLSRFVTSYHEGIRKYAAAWSLLGQSSQREQTARLRLESLHQSVDMVSRQWTEARIRERHPTEAADDEASANGDEGERKEPAFGNVESLDDHRGKRFGTDDK